MRLVPAQRYPEELENVIHRAQKRIVLAAMIIYADAVTAPIFVAIESALRRGVTVHIAPDAYSYFLLTSQQAAEGHFIRIWRQIRRTKAELETLRHAGARISLLGTLGLNPFKGRFHQKITIIDDEVYVAGGVNFSSEQFTLTDYMIHCSDASLANVLINQLQRIIYSGTIEDFSRQISPDTTLLIDGGIPHHSIIYTRAIQLARAAKTIEFVSQFCPSGELAEVLRAKKARCYFNRPAQLRGLSIGSQIFDRRRFGITNYYKKPNYIHAKFILYTMPDGQKVLLSGSHNFSKRGVDYGTKEVAIESTNRALWNELAQFSREQIH